MEFSHLADFERAEVCRRVDDHAEANERIMNIPEALGLLLLGSIVILPVFLVMFIAIAIKRGRINLLAYLMLVSLCFLSGWQGVTSLLFNTDLDDFIYDSVMVGALVYGMLGVYLGVVTILKFSSNLGPLPDVTLRGKGLLIFTYAFVVAAASGTALHGVMYQ